MSYDERDLPVSDALRPWISGISVATPGRGGVGTVLAEPDHATTLAVREGALVVMGPRTRARYHAPRPFTSCLTIRLRPGRVRALLDRSARDLVDRVVPLGGRWGDLPGELTDLADLDDALIRRLPVLGGTARSRGDLVSAAVASLTSDGVGATARRLNVSERHLRAVFIETVGVAPKHFARIERVRAVLDGAERGRLAGGAIEAGYYDQSHMTAEFRDVMGIPPGRFVEGRLPPAGDCAGIGVR